MGIVEGWAENSSSKGAAQSVGGPEPGTNGHLQTEQFFSRWTQSLTSALVYIHHTSLTLDAGKFNCTPLS